MFHPAARRRRCWRVGKGRQLGIWPVLANDGANCLDQRTCFGAARLPVDSCNFASHPRPAIRIHDRISFCVSDFVVDEIEPSDAGLYILRHQPQWQEPAVRTLCLRPIGERERARDLVKSEPRFKTIQCTDR